jgi:LysR family transcriptional regulator, hydrogen peroxide-inducible genes activator
MTLTELKYVVAVAQANHFGRAAERCFVSQPSLSAAVKNLEDELGVQIFERSKHEVLITAIGAQVITQAKRVLEEATRVKSIAQQGNNPLEGPLRLGVIHTVAPYLLPELVAAMRELAPKMPLDIEENMTANLERMLADGSIDIAIVALPFQATGVDIMPLYDEAFRAIVPIKHPWAKRKQIAVDELDSQNLLLLSIGHCFRDQVLDACQEFSRAPDPGKQGNSLETLRNMVASGMGISVLPATALTTKYSSPLIKAIDFKLPPSRRVVAAYRHGFPRFAAVEKIKQAFGNINLPIQAPQTGIVRRERP